MVKPLDTKKIDIKKLSENTSKEDLKELRERNIKIAEYIIVPIASAIFITSMVVYIDNFFTRFLLIFLISFLSFIIIYMYKKNMGMSTVDFKQKSLEILIKSSLNSIGIMIYVSLLLYGDIQPILIFDAGEMILVIGLRTLFVDIGLWILIWVTAFILSKLMSNQMSAG